MKSESEIERLAKKIRFSPNAAADERILTSAEAALEKSIKAKPAALQPNIWRTVARSRIAQIAAVLIVLSAICLLTLSDRGELEQQETDGPVVAVRSKTPAELVSAISLNMVFRDVDMEAMEKQFDEAEKKVKPGLKERLTIDQLICELEECEEI